MKIGRDDTFQFTRPSNANMASVSDELTGTEDAIRALRRSSRRQPLMPKGEYPERMPNVNHYEDRENSDAMREAAASTSYPPEPSNVNVRRMNFPPRQVLGELSTKYKSQPAAESATKTSSEAPVPGYGGDEDKPWYGTSGLPYQVSRFIENMRVAHSGERPDYSAAQHIRELQLKGEQAPILAEQRRRADEDRLMKQKLDAARLLTEQRKAEAYGQEKAISPEEARLKNAKAAQIEDKVRHADEERQAANLQRAYSAGRALQGEAKDLSKRLEKYAGLYRSLVDFNNDYPGVTYGASDMPELNIADRIKADIGWTSGLENEKQKLVMMAMDFRDKVEKARTGASARGEETKTYDAILGMGLGSSPEQLARGIKMFANEARTKIATAYQGVSSEAQRIYEKDADPDIVVLRNSPVFVAPKSSSTRQSNASPTQAGTSGRMSGRENFPPHPTNIRLGDAVLVRERGALPHKAQWVEKSALKDLFEKDNDLEFVRPEDEQFLNQ
jgi:hypothetical protein